MDVETGEMKPHVDCQPTSKEDNTPWCGYHNQLLAVCYAEMEQGAPEPTRQRTLFQSRLENLALLPPGFRLMVIASDPHANLTVQVLDPLDNGFATWELMGIIEFIRTQLRMTASQQIMQTEMHRHAPEEDEAPPSLQ